MKSGMTVNAENITLTSIEVECQITLSFGATLTEAWRAAADDLAAYLDWRTWAFGESPSASEMYDLIKNASGVDTVDLATFSPSGDPAVGAFSLPTLVRLSVLDTATGDSIDAALAVGF